MAFLGLSTDDLWIMSLAPAVVISFSITSAAFMALDLGLAPWPFAGMLERTQDKPAPTWAQYCGLWRVVFLQNLLTVMVTFPPLTLWVFRTMGVEVAWPPSLREFAQEAASIAVAYDLWFSVFHRAMHTPSLYKFHKRHHEWKSPCAFEGAYFDLFDLIVGNFGPMVLIPPLFSSHFFTILTFGVVGGVSVAISHSGYRFPVFLDRLMLKPGAHHDLHHEFFSVNYSHFGVLDWIFGTRLTTADAVDRREASSRRSSCASQSSGDTGDILKASRRSSSASTCSSETKKTC